MPVSLDPSWGMDGSPNLPIKNNWIPHCLPGKIASKSSPFSKDFFYMAGCRVSKLE